MGHRGGGADRPRRRRRATYSRTAGVRHLLAGYDLTRDRVYGHIKPVKNRSRLRQEGESAGTTRTSSVPSSWSSCRTR